MFSDSELVVKQLNGEYRVKNEGLQDLFTKVRALEKLVKGPVIYTHVLRTNIHIAKVDKACNDALDGK